MRLPRVVIKKDDEPRGNRRGAFMARMANNETVCLCAASLNQRQSMRTTERKEVERLLQRPTIDRVEPMKQDDERKKNR